MGPAKTAGPHPARSPRPSPAEDGPGWRAGSPQQHRSSSPRRRRQRRPLPSPRQRHGDQASDAKGADKTTGHGADGMLRRLFSRIGRPGPLQQRHDAKEPANGRQHPGPGARQDQSGGQQQARGAGERPAPPPCAAASGSPIAPPARRLSGRATRRSGRSASPTRASRPRPA